MADRETALSILNRLVESGHRALFCGGCVRDALLGVRPKDHDIVTSARPEEIRDLFARTHEVGRQFGIIVVIERGIPHEVATFRSDGEYRDGRHPVRVEYGSEEEDARRRDFTINGLFQDPLTGELIDHVGGREDLESGQIRTIGDPDQRFAEDHLRLLRAARLAAQLDFEIEKETRQAMIRGASSLTGISRERIGDEVEKILTGPRPGAGGQVLEETGLLTVAIPGLSGLDGSARRCAIRRLEGLGPRPDLSIALAALLLDVARQGSDIEEIVRDLRRGRSVIRRVGCLLAEEGVLGQYDVLTIAEKKRFLRWELHEELLVLMELDAAAREEEGEPARLLAQRCRSERARFEADGVGLQPEVPIGGEDLTRLGIASGPLFGEILRAVEDEVLEGRVRTREEAIEWIQEELKRGGNRF